MSLYFSKKKFQERAGMAIKRQLSKDHLDIVDGMEVVKEKNHYMIPFYTINGKNFYMYPISRNWCTESKQGNLFEQEGE
ncbi:MULTISPECIES: hypothetical protein [unclassified Enterococcus]|uniref:hypothetical protein n=1 Tax=unclassified Enterococcus TaxID=2608891 RepID=UPI001551B0F9|nr:MULTISPECIES: hypothetical protein [unclassified Enterococcus]MBS7578313.1 hypothetical protein [Enterococcus sp. MMGLQ5-2]MBS7585476.1 hypothetical protein [Enterococcus sp. MMGLQ5-1]NPD13333.1 hypothetical protein [Enterococcus sp. MMGLQ5-1]NPD38144.1 hypothetical protein [Enterococcus sp. MMGLQ5-2]